jgi:signal transduction histidine kinase
MIDVTDWDRPLQALSDAPPRPEWRWPSRVACALACFDLGLLVPILLLAVINRQAPDVWKLADPSQLVTGVVYASAGGLLATRRPGNAIGWLFLTISLVSQLSAVAGQWAIYGLETHAHRPGAAYMLWIGLGFSGATLALTPAFALLLFPSGRLQSRGTRVVACLASVPTVCLPLFLMTGTTIPPGFSTLYERHPNPMALARPLGDPGLMVALLGLSGLVSIGLLLLRFRTAVGLERQQYIWVVLAMGFIVLAFVADFAARASNTGAFVVTGPALGIAFTLLPITMGVAILRYHLWDIDILISRTLVYLCLSASVVAIYVFIVGWLGTTFQTGSNLFFSLLATGVVAVLFQPLRERIQRMVNLRIYGERDEPYTAISRLSRRLEDALAVESVLPAIASTIREALKLPYAAVALQLQHGGAQSLVASGVPTAHPLRLPLMYQQEPVGELLLAPRAPGESFSPADRRLLDDLARQAGVAVHAVRLTHELQHARERLVAAREEERRRLRRDLHDGLGSQLAALNLQAGALRGLIETDPTAAQTEVGELRAQLKDAIASIRTLVHSLRPPAIDELGLLTALRERARQFNSAELEIDVRLPEQLPELSAAVEVALYRIVEEALTNVTKHAHARHCVVRLAVGATVQLTVDDDGRGIGAGAGLGVGLGSMRERAEELGGVCAIEPAVGGGTSVSVRLPRAGERAADV